MRKPPDIAAGVTSAAGRQARRDRWMALPLLAAAALIASPSDAGAQNFADGTPSSSIATSLPYNGDPTGLRRWLAGHGIVYGLIYTNDVLGNVSGGLRRGFIDQGKLEATVLIDLEKAAGLQGLS